MTSFDTYITSTDEHLVDPNDPEWDEDEVDRAVAYEVTVDSDRNEIIVESPKDNFAGRILGLDVDNEDELRDHQGHIFEAITEMRQLESDTGGLYEMWAEVFPDGNPDLPVKFEYLFLFDRGSVGSRVTTEIDGHKYGFETIYEDGTRPFSPLDIYEDQYERQLRQLREKLWADFIVEKSTLDTGEEDGE